MAKDNEETKTIVETGKYKTFPMFEIWEIRPDGAKKDKPVLNIGVTKAKFIVKHLAELEKFVKDNV